MIAHFGDTGEFSTKPPPDEAVKRRAWSHNRQVSVIILLTISFLFVIDVLAQSRHGLDELPQVALDVIRANWIVGIGAVLLIWAYDVTAPKVFSRLAALREGLRDISHLQTRIAEAQRAQAAELTALRRAQAESVLEATLERQLSNDQLRHMSEAFRHLAETVDDREMAKYVEGFNAALDRHVSRIPAQPDPGARERTVVPITTGYRRAP